MRNFCSSTAMYLVNLIRNLGYFVVFLFSIFKSGFLDGKNIRIFIYQLYSVGHLSLVVMLVSGFFIGIVI